MTPVHFEMKFDLLIQYVEMHALYHAYTLVHVLLCVQLVPIAPVFKADYPCALLSLCMFASVCVTIFPSCVFVILPTVYLHQMCLVPSLLEALMIEGGPCY